MGIHSFSKTERLKSSKLFRQVMLEGQSIFQYPLKFIFVVKPFQHDAMVLLTGVSVSKKKHPKAFIRNLLKRRMREAFRLNNEAMKNWLEQSTGYSVALVIVYQIGEVTPYQSIENSMIKGLGRVLHQIQSSPVPDL